MITSFPLTWPEGYNRTKYPKRSKFNKVSLAVATEEVLHELKLMRVYKSSIIISTNVKLRNDGLPYSGQKQPDDKGVSVWFTLEKSQRVLACDLWSSVEENLWAIAKTVNAMRSIDRWGVSDMLNRMFTGFVALPESTDWKEILEIQGNQAFEEVKQSYYRLCRIHHPDNGGSAEKMAEINNAFEQAKKELNVR